MTYFIKKNNGSIEEFTTLELAIARLNDILEEETHYNYKINKNNSYTLYNYDNIKDITDIVIDTISIKEWYNLNYSQKQKHLKV